MQNNTVVLINCHTVLNIHKKITENKASSYIYFKKITLTAAVARKSMGTFTITKTPKINYALIQFSGNESIFLKSNSGAITTLLSVSPKYAAHQ